MLLLVVMVVVVLMAFLFLLCVLFVLFFVHVVAGHCGSGWPKEEAKATVYSDSKCGN